MAKKDSKQEKEVCGIVMPISAIDGCEPSHWNEVKEIISASISDAGYVPRLVSDADDVGIIQARIVQNLYDNPIVVCDVSGKNPNVMFELGLRLAFDKPTIVIKDNKTSYMFDTGQVEHIEYPRELRFSAINDFKKLLSDKITATHAKAKADPDYSTFLKHFSRVKLAKLNEIEVTGQEFLMKEIRNLRSSFEAYTSNQSSTDKLLSLPSAVIDLYSSGKSQCEGLKNTAMQEIFVVDARVVGTNNDKKMIVYFDVDTPQKEIISVIRNLEMDIIPF